jgi:hypothetical protein
MRIRSIKPEFWRSDDIDRLDWHTRLLFIGMWSYVDDNGVGRDRESDIAADLFSSDLSRDPRDTLARVADGLQQLSAGGQIVRYTVAGKRFLHITAWESHQKIDRPAKPRYPLPEDADPPETKGSGAPSRDPRETVANSSRDPRESASTGTGEQGNRGTGEEPLAPATPPRAERPRDALFDAVVEVCGIDPKTLTASGRGAINNSLKQLREVEATPPQVQLRANRYRQQYRDAPLTPSALAKHWGSLTGASPPPGQRPFDPLASARPRSRT